MHPKGRYTCRQGEECVTKPGHDLASRLRRACRIWDEAKTGIMKLLDILLWLAAYSGCLLHILLFALIYYKYRDKTELRFLCVLINVLVVTAIIMILNQTAGNAKIFNLILANSLLSFFVTVPLFIYKENAVEKKYYFLMPLVVLAAAFVYNFFILINYTAIAFLPTPVFFIILYIPVFLKKPNGPAKNRNSRELEKTGIIMAIITVVFTFAAFPLSKLAVKIPWLFSIHFAVFTLAYQIPGFFYCKNRLRQSSKATGLAQLTKREKEVAEEICRGLKYEEIADKLCVSLSAVKKHAYHIYRKLDIKNNRELMLRLNAPRDQDGG
jgi:DNA-binding CsgD family transcriptional regulator